MMSQPPAASWAMMAAAFVVPGLPMQSIVPLFVGPVLLVGLHQHSRDQAPLPVGQDPVLGSVIDPLLKDMAVSPVSAAFVSSPVAPSVTPLLMVACWALPEMSSAIEPV